MSAGFSCNQRNTGGHRCERMTVLQGGEYARFQFVQSYADRRYSQISRARPGYLLSLGIQDETKSGATFPSSQRRGGCATNKCRGATEAAQTGWSDRHGRVFAELTTPSAPIKVASRNLIRVAATPPLRGGECSRSRFVSY